MFHNAICDDLPKERIKIRQEIQNGLDGVDTARRLRAGGCRINIIFLTTNDFRMENGEIVPIRIRERRAIRETYFRYIAEKIYETRSDSI